MTIDACQISYFYVHRVLVLVIVAALKGNRKQCRLYMLVLLVCLWMF